MIPITILTGFLGSGKTTLLKQIIEQNPNKKFGLIINEYGQVGIDGQLVEDSGEEIVELSNGCMCCIVRTDLYKATQKLIQDTDVDYILIEASGLAESKPIADTFVMNNLNNQVTLDSIVCVIDIENFHKKNTDAKIALNQLKFADIIVINKVQSQSQEDILKIKKEVSKINPEASILLNTNQELKTTLLIDNHNWSIDRILDQKEAINTTESGHHHHEHNHNNYQEVFFISDNQVALDPKKLDNWLQFSFPENCVRAKGILNLAISRVDGETKTGTYLFQMVGASKMLTPFESKTPVTQSKLVLIGQELDESKILADLVNCAYQSK